MKNLDRNPLEVENEDLKKKIDALSAECIELKLRNERLSKDNTAPEEQLQEKDEFIQELKIKLNFLYGLAKGYENAISGGNKEIANEVDLL